MATTQTVLGINLVKGPHVGGELYAYEMAVRITGTYATGATPSVDFLGALQAQHQGVSAVDVKSVTCWQDGVNQADATLPRVTAPNGDIALSSTGNKTITFDIDKGSNGVAGTELGDSDPVDCVLSFLIVTGVTKAAS